MKLVWGFLLFSSTLLAQELNQACHLFKDQKINLRSDIEVKNYKVHLQSCENNKWIAIREFESHSLSYKLIVNSQTLETDIVQSSCLKCEEVSLVNLRAATYTKLLNFSKSHSSPMSDAGISRIDSEKGIFLSVDLCPSQKQFDYRIFENSHVSARKDFPVAVAISGGWLKHHQDSFNWLKAKQINHDLDIVWVNHSYTHPYKKGIPNNENFLLTPGDSLDAEIFNQEKYMISNGITPSVFFRFPGLISNSQLVTELANYGLLTLGSDAWLALGQRPKAGSIILIHGNGNEEFGVQLFMHLLEQIQNINIFKSLAPRA